MKEINNFYILIISNLFIIYYNNWENKCERLFSIVIDYQI